MTRQIQENYTRKKIKKRQKFERKLVRNYVNINTDMKIGN